MPMAVPAMLSAGVSVGIGALTGATYAGTFLGMSGAFGYFVQQTALFTALGYASNALSPKPRYSGGASTGYTANTLSSAAPSAYIYGETRVGGVVFYQATTGDTQYLHRAIALAGHEVNAIGDIYLNDTKLTLDEDGNCTAPSTYSGKVFVSKNLGTDDQVADPNLVSAIAKWTSDHRARGIAYIYVRLKYDADSFPNGVPNVTAMVQGKKIYDPRTEVTAFSDCPALCLRDYLISSGIADSTEINDVLFSAAASICDAETVDLATGDSQSRYTCNGTFSSDIAPADAIQNILASMGGMIWYSQGKWGCKAAAYTAPVLELTEDDLRGSLSIATRSSRRDAFNQVTGIFKGAESNYVETNYPSLRSQTFVDVDGGQESELEINLPFTDNSAMAQRISKIALYRNREQLKIRGTFGLRAMALGVGDIIQVTNSRMGFSAKEFEVVDWSFGLDSSMALKVDMTLQEISSAVFDWDADEKSFEANNTDLLSPFYVPDIQVELSQAYRVVNETVTNVLLIDTSSIQSAYIDYVEVQYKKSNETEYSVLGTGDLGRFEILNIDTPLVTDTTSISYNVRVRGFNALGVKGQFTAATRVIEADTTGPSAPTNLSHIISGNSIYFTWSASPDADLSHYELYHSPNYNAIFGDGTATKMIDKIARPATSISFPVRYGTFFIEPYDKTGNSGGTASVVIDQSQLPILSNIQTDTEAPTFGGTHTNTLVFDSKLLLDDYTTAPSTGTYEFTGYLDTGANRTVRASYYVAVERQLDSETWDSMPNNWDSWYGNWDSWTDSGQFFGDYNVIVYIMATDVDAGGGTPDWTGKSWVVSTGNINGRWFKFKAVLTSSADGVTPLISELDGIVEY